MLTKDDAPRLKKLIKALMDAKYTDMPGKNMVELVAHISWLDNVVQKLERPAIKPVGPPVPLDKPKRKK